MDHAFRANQQMNCFCFASFFHKHHALHAAATASATAHLPPALQHLRNIILQKYMENAIKQEIPIDLTVPPADLSRKMTSSTGSHSPRSEISSDISNKSNDEEEIPGPRRAIFKV